MFHFSKPKPPVKTFCPPKEFEYNLHLALRLLASEHRGDCACVISAENGTVTLYIDGIRDLVGLAERTTPGAYKYFFCHPTYSNGRLRMTFQEPDCYIFGCLREGMQYDLDQHAPNARISTWLDNAGKKQIYIAFDPYPQEDEFARWKASEAFYNIWCK